jgi:hypothetical protein
MGSAGRWTKSGVRIAADQAWSIEEIVPNVWSSPGRNASRLLSFEITHYRIQHLTILPGGIVMTNRHTVAALIVLVVGLVAPSSARAQIVPSPSWGEPIQDPSRFVVLASYNNEAVYDQETGLVWELAPSTTVQTWANAQVGCTNKPVGNRKGWRLPTVQELGSLLDPTVPFPELPLPAGNPFTVLGAPYWSGTTVARQTTTVWAVSLFTGNLGTADMSQQFYVWCVRGGQGANPQ